MKVTAQERVWWSPTLTATDSHNQPVTVDVAGWEASFDGQATWLPARDNEGDPGWLIAGAGYPGPGDDAGGITADLVMPRDQIVKVHLRHRDMPETTINDDLTLSPW